MNQWVKLPEFCSIDGCGKKRLARGYCQSHWRKWSNYGDPLFVKVRKKVSKPNCRGRKFFIEVVLPYEGDECLIWPFARNAKGYGPVAWNGRRALVHRLACEQVHGQPPTDKHQAAHSCGQGKNGCVNPRHLRWATQKENDADKVIHGTLLRGDLLKSSKLKPDQVVQIRSLDGSILRSQIAEMFGISRNHVGNIVRRETWSWLP